MMEIDIPGFRVLRLEHLVLDFNGTLARDGKLLSGVGAALAALAEKLHVHVLTADTFGTAREQLRDVHGTWTVLAENDQDAAKFEYVRRLGAERAVCIGNGRNDRGMLEAAALGIVVILDEGAAGAALRAADVVCVDILVALELLRHPRRLVATLRS